ncbi:alpha/beta hydrolase family protein [Parvibaculum sp.]|uniref:alpha/beta hydrolase family protein n=1 Tax=Parvibaculum sp. TaxID=2024848 RepID=UPI00391A5F79
MTLRPALAVIAALLLAACTVATPAERKINADQIAAAGALSPLTIQTAKFDLHARLKTGGASDTLVIYIEGDGFAWKRINERSADPTPLNPLALRLAALDDAPSVAWLARPCQFTGGETARGCNSDLWTGARYSEAVIAASNDAIDLLKRKAGAERIALVGYSGGGVVAALAAMRRFDVIWLKTVAAPLDTTAFTAQHKLTPMTGSLNPADRAKNLATLPQIHYAGARDKLVPPAVNRSFLVRMGEERCITLEELLGVSHDEGWEKVWATRAAETPVCQ